MANTIIGGVVNAAHILSEATAQRDIVEYGQQPLTLV